MGVLVRPVRGKKKSHGISDLTGECMARAACGGFWASGEASFLLVDGLLPRSGLLAPQEGSGAPQIVGDGGEPHLQCRLGPPRPAHAAKAIAAVEVVQRQLGEAGRLDRLCPRRAVQVGARRGSRCSARAKATRSGSNSNFLPSARRSRYSGRPCRCQRRPNTSAGPQLLSARTNRSSLAASTTFEPGAEAHQRLEQAVQLAGGHQHIAAAEAGHQLLPHAVAVADRADDLQVLVVPAVLNDRLHPDEHEPIISKAAEKSTGSCRHTTEFATTFPPRGRWRPT